MSLYVALMRLPNDADIAYSEVKASKRRLDESAAAYAEAVDRFQRMLDAKIPVCEEQRGLGEYERQPRGRVQDLVKLAFSSGSLRRARFKDVVNIVGSYGGFAPSEATVRQTLYRMEQAGELERYSGQWSAGRLLKLAKK